jgi:hypothetical protein
LGEVVNNTSTQKQNKPTQGQWFCNFGNGTHLENDVTIWGNDGLTPIAEILNDPHLESPEWEEAAANARLIAAAPELLAALKAISDLANDPAGSTFTLREAFGTFHCSMQPEGKLALAAISKAEGAS